MELGDLIFYVVLFGAWFLSFLAKKLSTSDPSPEKKGLTLRILEFIAEFKSAAEKQAEEHYRFSSAKMPLSPEGEGNENTVPISKDLPLRRKQTQPQKKGIINEESCTAHTPLMAHAPRKIRQKFPRKKMQSAIIWSEILQPPIGLRE